MSELTHDSLRRYHLALDVEVDTLGELSEVLHDLASEALRNKVPPRRVSSRGYTLTMTRRKD